VLSVSLGETVGVLAVAAFAFVKIDLVPTALLVSLPHVVRDHAFGDARFSIAGIWPETLREGQAVVDAHKTSDGKPPVIWSTYAGWIEARNGVFNPSTDYIIHALGPKARDEYVDAFRAARPQLVQTVRPSYTVYETWVENTSWAFYDELLDWYTVEAKTPWSLFWTLRATRADSLRFLGMMNVPAGMDSVQFPQVFAPGETTPALIEVEVEYEARNPFAKLPIIGATPRFMIGIQGAMNRLSVSLDPFVKRERFPVIVAPGQVPMLRFATFSLLPGTSWAPRTIRLFRRPLDAGASVWLADLLTTLQPPR
jgi:hypothetical protein